MPILQVQSKTKTKHVVAYTTVAVATIAVGGAIISNLFGVTPAQVNPGTSPKCRSGPSTITRSVTISVDTCVNAAPGCYQKVQEKIDAALSAWQCSQPCFRQRNSIRGDESCPVTLSTNSNSNTNGAVGMWCQMSVEVKCDDRKGAGWVSF